MVRLSPRRNQRSNKGFKVKHALQICLLIGVCIWLLYQVRHSHEKRASFGEGPKTENEIVKMGRKDLRPQVEETTIRDARHKEGEDEEESKDEEEQNKPEESDNAGKGGGNDEIDEHDKVKVEEEKKENVSEENERDKEFEESKEPSNHEWREVFMKSPTKVKKATGSPSMHPVVAPFAEHPLCSKLLFVFP